MRSHRRWCAVFVAAVAAAAGCGGAKAPAPAPDTLTTRERQEAIGGSGLPGATGIRKAIEVADSATARNRILDSIGQ